MQHEIIERAAANEVSVAAMAKDAADKLSAEATAIKDKAEGMVQQMRAIVNG